MDCFFEAIKKRRTYYTINSESVIDDERIKEIVNEAVKHSPSSFNSQSARVVVLTGDHHVLLWDIVKNELKKIVVPENFQATEKKINVQFQSGHGTILYFEDSDVIQELQAKYPLYKDAFPVFSHHSSGMLQFIIWTALSNEGLGASLQHYNPVIDEAVKAQWKLSASWILLAQMPFGKPTAEPSPKTFAPLESRVKFFG